MVTQPGPRPHRVKKSQAVVGLKVRPALVTSDLMELMMCILLSNEKRCVMCTWQTASWSRPRNSSCSISTLVTSSSSFWFCWHRDRYVAHHSLFISCALFSFISCYVFICVLSSLPVSNRFVCTTLFMHCFSINIRMYYCTPL